MRELRMVAIGQSIAKRIDLRRGRFQALQVPGRIVLVMLTIGNHDKALAKGRVKVTIDGGCASHEQTFIWAGTIVQPHLPLPVGTDSVFDYLRLSARAGLRRELALRFNPVLMRITGQSGRLSAFRDEVGVQGDIFV